MTVLPKTVYPVQAREAKKNILCPAADALYRPRKGIPHTGDFCPSEMASVAFHAVKCT